MYEFLRPSKRFYEGTVTLTLPPTAIDIYVKSLIRFHINVAAVAEAQQKQAQDVVAFLMQSIK